MKRAFQVSITLSLAAFLLLPMPGHTASLDHRIRVVKAKIQAKKAKEGVLTSTITNVNTRIQGLQGQTRGLQARQNHVQETLTQKQAELCATQDKLEKAKSRVAQLKLYLARAERVPGQRLVEMYKDGEPDARTVMLD